MKTISGFGVENRLPPARFSTFLCFLLLQVVDSNEATNNEPTVLCTHINCFLGNIAVSHGASSALLNLARVHHDSCRPGGAAEGSKNFLGS